jgi:hypothetical protein
LGRIGGARDQPLGPTSPTRAVRKTRT